MTIDEAIAILRLSPEMADTFRSVICRSRELASGLIDILAQIFNKLFAWAGHDVDFSKLNIGGDAGCKLHNNNINNPDLNGLYDRLTEGAKGAKEVMEQKK